MSAINKQILIILILLLIMYYYDNLNENFSLKNTNFINNNNNSINSGNSNLYSYTNGNRDSNYSISGIYPPRIIFYQNSNDDILYANGKSIGKTRQHIKLY